MVTIYHNPRCSKSRETLALLEANGIEPVIVRYLETPPDRETLQILLQKLGMSSVRQLMRTKEELYKTLRLEEADEAQLLEALSAHPALLERPVVINGDRARIGRPPEAVLEIL
ncbi:MAG: arsenate reductase (glutaredoxin) [Pantoea sp.]|jgi:arsenate reductase|uniref:arsenate reductase (glutaredoxin) n=1 Tax=Pantoea TaxID=53335 RepID=UPI000661305F|nr:MULTISPECIES: arsenate reductase (glutaredoxin) [Pantoea]MBS6437441.1 arsenate reductase (glutaredoxin) [Pantoea sp.]MDU1574493.1 arsenate reductase (glutaredoxin) [Pantoea sp.]MDU2728169.1 arsenate reductase (glutaredoxin) [Pantoea sp.]MDU5471800.1 arsenate reductase (glutaredoxin) [Pantoea sp.]MDU6078327.1 arsenate reductase (glutaredoxin) [Pantoea sp.]